MSWWQRLFGFTSGAQERAIVLYVRCDRCKTIVAVRVDRYNDLAIEYAANETEAGYIVTKHIVDTKCYRPITATLRFDTQRRELERTISGGTFVDAAAFADQQTPPSA